MFGQHIKRLRTQLKNLRVGEINYSYQLLFSYQTNQLLTPCRPIEFLNIYTLKESRMKFVEILEERVVRNEQN